MEIRTATLEDLKEITEVEAVCFPAAEAAGEESFRQRLTVYPDHFWVLTDGGRIVSVVDGPVTDDPDLKDEMYHDASCHRENGAWQMIFGVETIPEYQKRGCAERVLEHAIEEARKQGRKGLVLTCKDRLVHYYAKFGFQNEGASDSTHGGAAWNQMRITF